MSAKKQVNAQSPCHPPQEMIHSNPSLFNEESVDMSLKSIGSETSSARSTSSGGSGNLSATSLSSSRGSSAQVRGRRRYLSPP